MSKTTQRDEGPATLAEVITSRRAFLRNASLTAVGGALVACGKSGEAAPATPATPAAAPANAAPAMSAADAMDAMHEKGMKAFPAKTALHGNQILKPKLVDGVKLFELTAREIQWETAPGQKVAALAYNDQVPGPQIRVREGDRVRIVLRNELKQSRRCTSTGSSFRTIRTACRTSPSPP
jgi:FtsP/CotA-like multicopper oxidase with cupredoxin domain